ncbi:MAG: hypothetical protein WCO52_00560 [bacterium]
MAHRRRHAPLVFRLLAFLGAVYLVASLVILVTLSLPSSRQGLTELQVGQSQLLSHPTDATQSFNSAAADLEQGFQRLQGLPFLVKLVATIPPFRWEVRLLKGSHALAVAGGQASQLVASFPVLTPAQPEELSPLLRDSSSAYLHWYASHAQELADLQSNLDEANDQLQGIPDWILLGNSAQLRQLKADVAAADSNLQVARGVSDQLPVALGSKDTNTHTILVGFQYPAHLQDFGSQIVNYVLINGKGGAITGLTYSDQIPLAFSKTYPGLFAESSPQLANAYSSSLGTSVDGIVLLDAPFMDKLLGLSGPITTGRTENPTVSVISGKPQLLATPSLAALLPGLVDKLSRLPEAASRLALVLAEANQNKTLQLWARLSDLESVIAAHADSDQAPKEGNWLKTVGTTADPRTTQVSQAGTLFGHSLRQTVTLSGGSGSLDVYLPVQASNLAISQAYKLDSQPSWQRISVSLPATISYDLPDQPGFHDALMYLKQSGQDHEHLEASDFSFNGMVGGNLLLTR